LHPENDPLASRERPSCIPRTTLLHLGLVTELFVPENFRGSERFFGIGCPAVPELFTRFPEIWNFIVLL
jgi:hypothetical protein